MTYLLKESSSLDNENSHDYSDEDDLLILKDPPTNSRGII